MLPTALLDVAATDASTNTAKPITTKQAAVQYLADVKPYNVAWDKFGAAFEKWAKHTGGTAAHTGTFANPMVAAISTFDHKVLSQRWPANARSAIQTLVLDDAVLQGDLEGLPALNNLTLSSWAMSYRKDSTIDSAAADVVRSDLGLPLIKT